MPALPEFATPLPTPDSDGGTPFVWFAHPLNTTLTERLRAAGITPVKNAPYYIRGGTIHKLDPFEFSVLHAEQRFVQYDGSGKPVSISSTNRPDHVETVDAVIVVYHEGKALPARCTFKRAVVKGITGILSERAAMETDPEGWASRSAAHKVVMQLEPIWRLVTNCVTGERPSKAGNLYPTGRDTPRPTGPKEWAAIQALMSDPAATPELISLKNELSARYKGVPNAETA